MPGNDGGSVTRWIGGLRAGDGEAAQALWERYFDRLVRLARKRRPCRADGGGGRGRRGTRAPSTASAPAWPAGGSRSWEIATISGSCWW